MFARILMATLVCLSVTAVVPAQAQQANRAPTGQGQRKTVAQLYAELRALAQAFPNGGPELDAALQTYLAENPGAATALASLQQSEPGLFAKAGGGGGDGGNKQNSGSGSTPDTLIPSTSGGGGSLSGSTSPSF